MLSGALEGSGAALGRGFSSASTGGFFSAGGGGFFSAGAGLGVLLCSAARRLLAGEGCSGGAAGSVGAGAGVGALCCGPAGGGWCRGEPLDGAFGVGSGIGAGSPRLPSSSRWVWQFKHSHSFFCKRMEGKVEIPGASPQRGSADGTHGDGAEDSAQANQITGFGGACRVIAIPCKPSTSSGNPPLPLSRTQGCAARGTTAAAQGLHTLPHNPSASPALSFFSLAVFWF